LSSAPPVELEIKIEERREFVGESSAKIVDRDELANVSLAE